MARHRRYPRGQVRLIAAAAVLLAVIALGLLIAPHPRLHQEVMPVTTPSVTPPL